MIIKNINFHLIDACDLLNLLVSLYEILVLWDLNTPDRGTYTSLIAVFISSSSNPNLQSYIFLWIKLSYMISNAKIKSLFFIILTIHLQSTANYLFMMLSFKNWSILHILTNNHVKSTMAPVITVFFFVMISYKFYNLLSLLMKMLCIHGHACAHALSWYLTEKPSFCDLMFFIGVHVDSCISYVI